MQFKERGAHKNPVLFVSREFARIFCHIYYNGTRRKSFTGFLFTLVTL